MQEDIAKLTPDQKKIVEALNHGALELTRVPADEMTAIQNLNSSVFEPLKKLSTLQDVATLRAGGQSLLDAAAKNQKRLRSRTGRARTGFGPRRTGRAVSGLSERQIYRARQSTNGRANRGSR